MGCRLCNFVQFDLAWVGQSGKPLYKGCKLVHTWLWYHSFSFFISNICCSFFFFVFLFLLFFSFLLESLPSPLPDLPSYSVTSLLSPPTCLADCLLISSVGYINAHWYHTDMGASSICIGPRFYSLCICINLFFN